jgi:hypothetical protein
MKCFTHRESDAIAICRSCGRALCPDCIAEVGRSCACKNRCESDVKRLSEMLTQGRPAQVNPARLVGYDRVIFIMLMGVVFACWGLYYFRGHGPGMFFIGFGGLFFIFGISQFFAAKKFREQFRDKKD